MSDGTINFPNRDSSPDSPATGRSKIWVSSTDGKPRITDSLGNTQGFGSTFGSEFTLETRTTQATTSSTTMTTYSSYSPSVSGDGVYMVEAVLRYSMSSPDNNFRARLMIDGVNVAGNLVRRVRSTGDRHHGQIVAYVNGSDLSTTTPLIQLQYAVEFNWASATIYSSNITIKRVE